MADQVIGILVMVAFWIVSLAITYKRAEDKGYDEGVESAMDHVEIELAKQGINLRFKD